MTEEDVGLGVFFVIPGSFEIYTVKRGDALRKIALEKLGSANRADEIFELNRDKLEKPDLIYVGQVLRVPVNRTQ